MTCRCDFEASIKAWRTADVTSSLQKFHLFRKAAKSGEMFTNQMAGWESSHPSSARPIIHLDEDGPHAISILTAPNYPEQGPAKPKAPASFSRLKGDKSGRLLGWRHARLGAVGVFVLSTDATIKSGLHRRAPVSQPPRLAQI